MLLAAGALVGGCAREAPVSYSPSPQLAELEPARAGEVQGILEKWFGTPDRPRFDLPVSESDQAEPILDPARLAHGAQVFQVQCANCHGPTGDGKGPAAEYLDPRPRDYRRGIFKFTSTPYGAKPRRQDLVRVVRRGAKGTSMPGFPLMADEDVEAVVDYVILLAHRGELESLLAGEASALSPGDLLDPEVVAELAMLISGSWSEAASLEVMPASARPAFDDESIRLGQAAFLEKGCAKCHGADGRGHTQDNVGQDAWGRTVKAADISAGMLHGGRRPIDVYRRIYSGINGTPMPAFNQALAAEPDTVWHMTHFVLGIVERRPSAVAPAEGAGAAAPAPEDAAAPGETPAPNP
jgi:mono/diheme cytochrome c family protein